MVDWMIEHAYTYGIAIYIVCLIVKCVLSIMYRSCKHR